MDDTIVKGDDDGLTYSLPESFCIKLTGGIIPFSGEQALVHSSAEAP